jgi:hypothetical protein
VRTQPGSNSGIYEIQIADSFGKPVDPHNMGALRRKPQRNKLCLAEKAR